MERALKLLTILSYITSSCFCLINQTKGSPGEGLASYDLDAHLIQSRLDAVKQDRLNCFYRQGVNDESFEKCCGENYAKLENIFVNQYRILEQQLEDSFNHRIESACIGDRAPCEELSAEFSDSVRYDRDLYESVVAKKKEIETNTKIDKLSLDTAFNRFETNYKALMNARVLVSNSMENTVEAIQNFINESKLDITHDYMKFEPHFLYKSASSDGPGFNDEHFKALTATAHDFTSAFLAEGDAKRMIDYYIGKGMVKSSEINTSKMPSEQLKTVKEILTAKAHKVNL